MLNCCKFEKWKKGCGPLVREENGRKIKNLKMREKRAKVTNEIITTGKKRFSGGVGPPGKGDNGRKVNKT